MNTEPLNVCPECGKPVPAQSQHQLCPACLIAQALASRTMTGAGEKAGAVAPLPPEEIAGKFPQFEILECLGRGGMGVVYKARQKSLNRLVAIKILAPERKRDARFAERFAREAELLAKLSHPHIVTIHDFGETGGLYYLVMEFVDGVNLRDLLREGKLEPKQALAIVPPVCEALQYAHEKGVVHRDIKPENLLLDREGRVKIADFGIAALAGDPGERAGTPPYMAPEQVDAKPGVDHRADIYALGVVLYEMLTGELPGKKIELPSKKVQIDVRLDEVVLRALEKKPELRYQQVSDVKTMLETIAATPGSARGPRAESGGPPDSRETNREERASGGPPDAATGPVALPESRFSRKAIVAAGWAPFFFIALILMFWAVRPVVVPAGSPPHGVDLLALLIGLPLALLGLTAPFGTTILGWIAVTQIRRSAGKLHGLWLAVFDGLLFSLLALDGLICWVCLTMSRMFVDFYANPALQNRPDVNPALSTKLANYLADHHEIPILAAIITIVIVDFLIIRRVWRAVNKPAARPGSSVSGAQLRGRNRWLRHTKGLGWSAFLLALVIGGCGLAYGCREQKAEQLRMEKQAELIQQMSGPIDAHLAQAGMKRGIMSFEFTRDGLWGAMGMQDISSVKAQDVRSASGAEPGKLIAKEGRLHCFDRGGGDWWVQGEGPLRQVAFAMKGPRLARGDATAFPYALSEPYPVRTLTCASDGRKIQIPDPAAFMSLVRQMPEYKAWRKVRNMETFFLTTRSDYRFEAHFMGQARTAGGKEVDLITDAVLFRPDRTRLASAFLGASDNEQWQMSIYDGSGEKELARIRWKRTPGAPQGRVDSLHVGPWNTEDEHICDVDEHAVIQDKTYPFIMLPELEAILGETALQVSKPDSAMSMAVVSTNHSFGPVIERLLVVDSADPDIVESLNLGTGRKTPHLRDFERELQETVNWMRAMNLDLRGDIREQRPSVVCFDMAVMPVDRNRWEQTTADELLQDKGLASISPPLRVIESENTFVFRSRSGQTGILQITGFTENPRAVKVRYKLVQNATTAAADPEASQGGKPDYAQAAAALGAVDKWGEALGAAVEKGDQAAALKTSGLLLEQLRLLDAQVRGTEVELPANFVSLMTQGHEAIQAGDMKLAESLFPAASQAFEDFQHTLPGGDYKARLLKLAAQQRGATQPPPATNSLSFGPVIERTLKSPAADRANSYIDLESGNVVALPAEINLKDDKAVSAWAAQNGVDAVADTSQEVRGLLGFQLHFAQVPDSEWEQATSSSIASNVVAQEFHSYKFGGAWPHGTNDTGHWEASAVTVSTAPRSRTFEFRTRENSLGVLQLLAVPGEPNGFVKFRYKLVQAGQPPLRTEQFENGELRLSEVDATRLEQFRQELLRRRDYDLNQHNGAPGPNSSYLDRWIWKVTQELASRTRNPDPKAALDCFDALAAADATLGKLIERKDAPGAMAWLDNTMKPKNEKIMALLAGTELEQRTRVLVERFVPLRAAIEKKDWAAVATWYSGNPDKTYESDLRRLAGDAKAGASHTAGFGPVMERTINDPRISLTNCLLDLDSRRLMTIDAGLQSQLTVARPQDVSSNAIAWTGQNGADVAAFPIIPEDGTVNAALRSFGMIIIPVTAEAWLSLTPSDIVSRLDKRAHEFGFIPEVAEIKADELTTGFLFKTREGNYGIMAFDGLTENPRGVKIRYKLVQSEKK